MFKKLSKFVLDLELKHAIVLGKHLSNFIIQKTYLDSSSSHIVLQYLNEKCFNFNLISADRISTQWHEVFRQGNKDILFYNMKIGQKVFLYKNCLVNIIDYRNGDNISLRYIKGSLNISQLLIDAREYHRPMSDNKSNYINYNKFEIFEHYGFGESTSSVKNKEHYQLSADDKIVEDCYDDNLTIYQNDKLLNYKKDDLFFKQTSDDPFDNLYYENDVLDFVESTNSWLKNRDWFLDKGIPYKRGVLLYGKGGTGKSSFAAALGMKYGIPVHQLYLANMNDSEFTRCWNTAASTSPSIVLLEDFDSVFNKRTPVNPKCTLNFDTVLNTMSGIKENSGIILIITTNHIENIDEAIGIINSDGVSTRPGRIDRVIHLDKMNKQNRHKLASKILYTWPEIIDEVVEETDGYTPAQVQETCIHRALLLIKNVENYN